MLGIAKNFVTSRPRGKITFLNSEKTTWFSMQLKSGNENNLNLGLVVLPSCLMCLLYRLHNLL